MKKTLLILLLIILTATYYAQSNKKNFQFDFLPPGMNFLPLKAGIDEPHMGIDVFTKNTNMKVDIGNSIDLFGFDFNNSLTKITVGADFFAYAYVTSVLHYRLQIDAIDGFFGGNITYSKSYTNYRIVGRFRYIHHSAHMVDGHWDSIRNEWIDTRHPTAFGDNYLEFLAAEEMNISKNYFRYYGGFTFSTGLTTKEKELKRTTGKAGFEYAFNNLLGKVFGKDENFFIAVNLDLIGIPKYVVNQNYMAGIKFGNWRGKGIILYASYYNGSDIFYQYFNERVSRFGIGFMIDFI